MANTSIPLTSLDFDTYKQGLKNFLSSQDELKDYDFEGSAINVLLDVLSYNTYQNAFYMNMVASEMFLDSAQLRDSIISHCKELNYVPRSFSSAFAIVDILIKSQDNNKNSIMIPRGTRFTAKVGDTSFIFTNADNIIMQGQNNFLANDVTLYEGNLVQETYVSGQRIIINNARADISSLVVTVMEDNGANILEYERATSLFNTNSLSKVYFIQGFYDDKYEVIFGDDQSGRKPKNNSVISIEYRVSSGELPNGANKFTAITTIDGETDITINATSPAGGGTVSETIEEIKFNAPRHFTTQERSVTTEDYANLLKINFPEINTVMAYGGEDITPPVYGKVYIAVDLKDVDIVPDSKKDLFYNFIKKRSPVSIEPVFVDPDVLYVDMSTLVKYNINKTSLSQTDIRSLVVAAVNQFAEDFLNDFGKAVRYSKVVEAIDDADISIISNETSIRMYKTLRAKNLLTDAHIFFGTPIASVISSFFKFRGQQCQIKNAGNVLSIYYADTSIQDVGSVDLDVGQIDINPIVLDDLAETIKFYANSRTLDISSTKNTIIKVLPSDITVSVQRISE